VSRTDENGNVTQYAYDNLNRISQVSYPDGTAKTFGYDSRGNMTSAANQGIGYSFSYDLNNRLTGILDSNGRSIAYQYDALGNRTQMTTPDGRTISYAYNNINRLTGILSSPGLYNFQFSYDLSGRRTGLSYPNGVTTNYSYSPSGYLMELVAQKLQQNPINSFSYTYDGMGNRTSMTDLSGVHNYTYGNIYQLIQATHPNMPTEQFGYDSVGNRISAEGEVVGTPVATNYSYDMENQLTKAEYPGMVAQYKYDPFGRRIEKNVNGDITRYVYDGANIVTEYDGNGNVKNAYIHNLAIDDPLAVQQGTNAYFYHKDGLGSVVNLTDSTGSVVKSYTYKSFGEIYSQAGSLVQPYTFTGREYDAESGLYYYRARYYDAEIGRFITKDPTGFASGDVNLYRFVFNNPVNRIDPWGLWGTMGAGPRPNPFDYWVNPYTYWRDFFGGAGDLYRNYRDMRDANTIGADKYFHCMAHCQAARRGLGGRDASEFFGEGRELFDEYVKRDSRSECDADRRANKQGRESDPNTPCSEVCSPLRPNGLSPRY
jgi:RHS repeat-associated protein